MLNLSGFLLRGAKEQSWIFLLAIIPMITDGIKSDCNHKSCR